VPGIASAVLVAVQFPTAELLIEPPAVRAVSHLDVREPLRDDGDDRGVDSDARTDDADDEPRLQCDEQLSNVGYQP